MVVLVEKVTHTKTDTQLTKQYTGTSIYWYYYFIIIIIIITIIIIIIIITCHYHSH